MCKSGGDSLLGTEGISHESVSMSKCHLRASPGTKPRWRCERCCSGDSETGQGGNSEPSNVATSHDGAYLALVLKKSWLLPPHQKCVKNQALDEVLVEKGKEE